MKTYEMTIRAQSGFGTALKGDTVFGHICWQAAYDSTLLGNPIASLLADYETDPFLVVSSAHMRLIHDGRTNYVLKRPDAPLEMFGSFRRKNRRCFLRERKELKSRKWVLMDPLKRMANLKSLDLKNDAELFEIAAKNLRGPIMDCAQTKAMKTLTTKFPQPRSSINRFTNTTGEDGFAPYIVEQQVYFPGTELSIFMGVGKQISVERVATALRRIGETGFGKDASTGLGRFEVLTFCEVDFSSWGSSEPDACYTLGPCVPEHGAFTETYFTPFTRFGRHGDVLAKSSNPFKNPVIMADEGALFMPRQRTFFQKPWVGSAVTTVSKAMRNAVTQGYSLYIPVRTEA